MWLFDGVILLVNQRYFCLCACASDRLPCCHSISCFLSSLPCWEHLSSFLSPLSICTACVFGLTLCDSFFSCTPLSVVYFWATMLLKIYKCIFVTLWLSVYVWVDMKRQAVNKIEWCFLSWDCSLISYIVCFYILW